MEVALKIDFSAGDLEQGFNPVFIYTYASRKKEVDSPGKKTFSMLPSPELIESYIKWQKEYRKLAKLPRGGFDDDDTGVLSVKSCTKKLSQLRKSLNCWLEPIKESLEPTFNANKPTRILCEIQTQNITADEDQDFLHRLPWQEWNLFPKDTEVEVIISFKEATWKVNSAELKPQSTSSKPVKILGILGSDKGIDIEKDRDFIFELTNEKPDFLIKPQKSELETFWDKEWDILFYAGHSDILRDGQSGLLYINSQEELDLQTIRRTIRVAVQKGLKLAIFNSCNGLGLARQLADLDLPYTIVWREPVSDIDAQTFLKYFLKAFVGGEDLVNSVWQARSKMRELSNLEKDLPGVTGLPIIVQNSAQDPLFWSQLSGLDIPSDLHNEILKWTGGQPYLTSLLFNLIDKYKSQDFLAHSSNDQAKWIEQLVFEKIIDDWNRDKRLLHFQHRQAQLLTDDQYLLSKLILYRNISKGKEIKNNNTDIELELEKTGLIIFQKNNWIITNQIYKEVFNWEWCDSQILRIFKEYPLDENIPIELEEYFKEKLNSDTKSQVFLVCTPQEQKIAKRLQIKLGIYGVNVTIATSNKTWSRQEEERIKKSDFFVVLLKNNTLPEREIIKFIEKAKLCKQEYNYPEIIGLISTDEELRHSYQNSEEFTIVSISNSLKEAEIKKLAQQFIPQVTFIEDPKDEERLEILFLKSESCYKTLFPDPDERDDFNRIESWLYQSYIESENWKTWKEVYSVLHIFDRVIGMSYLSVSLECQWCFGNYFGILKEARNVNKRAKYFFEEIEKTQFQSKAYNNQIFTLNDFKGIILEIDPINFQLLENANRRGKILGEADEEEILINLRNVRRLLLYQDHDIQAVLQGDGKTPLPYWQPSLKKELIPDNEVELILMVYLFDSKKREEIELNDILYFLYDKLFGEGYGERSETPIPDYMQYVRGVRERVEIAANNTGWQLGKLDTELLSNTLLLAKKEAYQAGRKNLFSF